MSTPCLPRGRARGHRVDVPVVRVGRSLPKSTSVAAAGFLEVRNFTQAYVERHGRPPGWTPATRWRPNEVLYDWTEAACALFLRRGPAYGIGGMYLEFENAATPSTVVTPPAYGRGPGAGLAYYAGLASSPARDYLRVPLTAALLSGSTDLARYPAGNIMTFFAQTEGTQGVHGKPFSDADNSIVFGGSLVAFVDPSDASRDVVVNRFYLPTDQQLLKLPNGQLGVETDWTLK